MVRVRFAPSPTGYLHIGGLRTALYDYLFAKQEKGKFILRIEDTDRTRYVDDAIESLIKALEWSGIEYDEGVFLEDGKIVEKGDYGPYIQSERLDIYKKYANELLENGHAYYCFCSKERLENLREEQMEKKLMLGYDGKCRELNSEEVQKRIDAGEEHVLRLKFPENKDIVYEDLLRGEISINTRDIDDQVLMKADGFPTYHMAVVIDDHLMKISHIVRGEEWITSAPKHAYLFEAFGWEVPKFVHLPTVLNKEKKKLSKRHGDVAVEDFKTKGYLPDALVNYLALIGWSPEDEEEFFSIDELIEAFSFDRVSRTGGVFDKEKLDWMNGHYIREYNLEELTKLSIPYLIKSGFIEKSDVETRFDWILALVSIVRDRMHRLDEISKNVDFIFDNNIEFEDEQAEETIKASNIADILKQFRVELESIDEVDEEFSKGIMKKIQKATGIKGKDLFMPTRIALTGQQHGPDLNNIILVLGKENLLKRFTIVENKLR